MAVGAYATYNFAVRLPSLPLPVDLLAAGMISAAFGVLFGLPSIRIKGFYLIASTLAAQFFVEWLLTKVSWFSNDDTSGVLSAPRLEILGWTIATPASRYLFVLAVTGFLFLFAASLVRSELGRRWMAVRDMDTAAAVIGIEVAKTKLLAFALSSFVLGIAGALWAFAYLGTVEPHGFDLNLSFQVLFIIIIGGMGSIAGSLYGAAFVVLLPIALSACLGCARRPRHRRRTSAERAEDRVRHIDHRVPRQGTGRPRTARATHAAAVPRADLACLIDPPGFISLPSLPHD